MVAVGRTTARRRERQAASGTCRAGGWAFTRLVNQGSGAAGGHREHCLHDPRQVMSPLRLVPLGVTTNVTVSLGHVVKPTHAWYCFLISHIFPDANNASFARCQAVPRGVLCLAGLFGGPDWPLRQPTYFVTLRQGSQSRLIRMKENLMNQPFYHHFFPRCGNRECLGGLLLPSLACSPRLVLFPTKYTASRKISSSGPIFSLRQFLRAPRRLLGFLWVCIFPLHAPKAMLLYHKNQKTVLNILTHSTSDPFQVDVIRHWNCYRIQAWG